MFDDEFSKFYSDDGKRESTIYRHEDTIKVVFEDKTSETSFFKYYRSINLAEDAAEDFVMYEAN